MAMGDMEMPAPDNTLPMMTGTGQFGPIEMGGMFTVMKIREGLGARRLQGSRARTNFRKGTVAYEVDALARRKHRGETSQRSRPSRPR